MKIIEIVTPAEKLTAVKSIISQHDSEVLWVSSDEYGKNMIRALVSDEKRQSVLDALQGLIGTQGTSKILVMNLEAALPRKVFSEEKPSPDSATTTREELYNEIETNTRLDSTYLLLVFLIR